MSACFSCAIVLPLLTMLGSSPHLHESCGAARQRFEAVGVGFRQRFKEGWAIPPLRPKKRSPAATHCMKNRNKSSLTARYIVLLHRCIACARGGECGCHS